MEFSKRINLIIYRFREKGLEIFLVDPSDTESWMLPSDQLSMKDQLTESDKLIELDPVKQENGELERGWAVEGDWHDIPSLKAMLYDDAMQLKEKLKEMETGGFFAVKEAVKKVLPHQYQLLKELKEILTDRNSIKNI